jgi:glycine/D-amino acid oxidase-like deaminating enzyme
MRIIVIGAGLFGITIALELAKRHRDVTLVDSNGDIMQNAGV